MKNLIFSIYFLLIFFNFSQKSFSQTPNNFNGWFPDRTITSVSSDDNYIYVGGEFSSFVKKGRGLNSGVGIVNYADKSISPMWNAHWASLGGMVPDGKGGWYAFSYIEFENTTSTGYDNHKLIHINSDYTLDKNWNSDINIDAILNAHVFTIMGDYLYLGGIFEDPVYRSIIRISTITGKTDYDWGKNAIMTQDSGNWAFLKKMVATNNSLIVIGNFDKVGNKNIERICKISLETGLPDENWNPNLDYVYNVAVDGDDLYLLGSSAQQTTILKVNVNTNIADPQWISPVLDGGINVIKFLNNDLYLGGYFRNINGINRNHVAKISKQGILDMNWDLHIDYTENINVYGYTYTTSSRIDEISIIGNNLYVGGLIRSVNGQPSANGARFSLNTGIVDNTWNVTTNDNITKIIPWKNGVLVKGYFTQIGCELRSKLARINKNTMELDPTWQPTANGYITATAILGNNFYVGGSFTKINNIPINSLAKISTTDTGTLDQNWQPEPKGGQAEIIQIITTLTDIYVCGRFSQAGGQPCSNIVKLSPNGTGLADANWKPNVVSEDISRMAISGTTLYIGGNMAVGGYYQRLLKMEATGTGKVDYTWKPNVFVYTSQNNYLPNIRILQVNNGYLYAGGQIEEVNDDKNYKGIVRFKISNGELDTSWKPGAVEYASSVLFDDDFIYVLGTYKNTNGKYEECIKKYNLVTNELTDWKVNIGDQANWERFLEKTANGIVVMGRFYTVNDYNTPFISSLNIQDIASTNEYFASSTKVYPNPVSDIVNIDVADAQYNNFKVTLLGSDGKIIQDVQSITRPEGFKMDISKLPAGLYFLRLESKNAKLIKRIVKL